MHLIQAQQGPILTNTNSNASLWPIEELETNSTNTGHFILPIIVLLLPRKYLYSVSRTREEQEASSSSAVVSLYSTVFFRSALRFTTSYIHSLHTVAVRV